MEHYKHDTLDELVDAYRRDLDYGRGEGWWARADYTAPTGFGTIHLQPLHAAGEPGGPVEKTWRAFVEVADGFVERHITDDYLPTAGEAQEVLEALIQQAQPTRDREQDRLTAKLGDLAAQISILTDLRKQTAVEAVKVGVMKTTVADAAGITRPTLDKWLRDR